MTAVRFLNKSELEAGLESIQKSPKMTGKLELIVCRPAENQRKVLETGQLDEIKGLIGDNWILKGSSKTKDGSAHPDMQINIMNARCINLIAGDKSRWPLAGDQLYVDLDLSENNLPPGTRLKIGSAELEITSIPHNGCDKFIERFGLDAVKFVNSKVGKAMHLRGLNAKIVKSGVIQEGDTVEKCS